MDDRPTNDPRCAECGRPRSDRSLPRPLGLLHWRRSVPVLAALLAISVIGGLSLAGRATVSTGTGIFNGALTDPPVTWAQVRGMGAGDTLSPAAGPELLAHVLEIVESRFWTGPFPLELRAAFTGPVPTRSTEVQMRGWPVRWMTRSVTRRHAADGTNLPITTDPDRPPDRGFGMSLNRDGRVAPRPRWEWGQSHLMFAPPPEETDGAIVRVMVRPTALALPLAAGWTTIVLVLASVAVIERVRRREWPRRRRRIVTAAALAVVGVLVIVAVTLGERSSRRTVDPSASSHPAAAWRGPLEHVPTSVDLEALAVQAADDPDAAARTLAEGIVAAIAAGPEPLPGEDDLLSLEIDMNGSSMATGTRIESPFPLGSITEKTWSEERFLGAPPTAAPAGTHVQLKRGFLVIERSDGDPATPSQEIVVLLIESGLVLLIVLGVGSTAGLVTHVVARRRAARRRRAGQCVACAHPFGPEAA